MKQIRWLLMVLTLGFLIDNSYALGKKDDFDLENDGNKNLNPSAIPNPNLDSSSSSSAIPSPNLDSSSSSSAIPSLNLDSSSSPNYVSVSLGEENSLKENPILKNFPKRTILQVIKDLSEIEVEWDNTENFTSTLVIKKEAFNKLSKILKIKEEKNLKDTYRKITEQKERLLYIIKYKWMSDIKEDIDIHSKKIYDVLNRIKIDFGYLNWNKFEDLKVENVLSDETKDLLRTYGFIKNSKNKTSLLKMYYSGLLDKMDPSTENILGNSYEEIFKNQKRLNNFKTELKKLYEKYKKFLKKNLKINIHTFEKEKDIVLTISLKTGVEGVSFKDILFKSEETTFLQKKKNEMICLDIDTNITVNQLLSALNISEYGLILAKLSLSVKGNELVQGKVLNDLDTMVNNKKVIDSTDLLDGTYGKEIYDKLIATEYSQIKTFPGNFHKNQILSIIPEDGSRAEIFSYPKDKPVYKFNKTHFPIGKKSIFLKKYSGEYYLHILCEGLNNHVTLAQQMKDTLLKDLEVSIHEIFFNSQISQADSISTNFTIGNAVPIHTIDFSKTKNNHKSSITSNTKVIGSKGNKAYLTVLPFDLFSSVTINPTSGIIEGMESIPIYLKMLKNFADKYISFIGKENLPNKNPMVALEKSIPSGKVSSYEIFKEPTTDIPTTSKYILYPNIYHSQFHKKRSFILSKRKISKHKKS